MSDTDPINEVEEETNDANVGQAAPSSGKTSKTKKPRKRRKKPAALPSLAAAESRLLWKTRHTPSLGRHAVAKQLIRQGQRVLVEEAAAAVPRERFSSVLCHQCLKNFSEFRSLEPDKEVPSAECYQASLLYDPEMARVFDELQEIAKEANCDAELLRLIIKLQYIKHAAVSDVQNERAELEEGQNWWMTEESPDLAMKSGWGDIRGLVRNWDKMGNDWKRSVTEACKSVRERLKNIPYFADVALCDLQELAAIVNTNSHGLGSVGAENTDLALGLFPVLSMFNHSCDPNCCFSGTGRVMTVRALREIEPGEQLTVSYINLMEPRYKRISRQGTRKEWLRQQMLQETRFFTCTCPRCTDDLHDSTDKLLEGVRCPAAKCSGLLIGKWDAELEQATWSCLECETCFISSVNPHSYQHPPMQPPDQAHDHHHHHDGHCCHGHHPHSHDHVHEEEEELPSLDAISHFKGSKNGKVEGFDPGAILVAAQEGLAQAMQAYSDRNLPRAIRLFDHHVKTFEVALNPFHVCVFDALTPLLNCHRSIDDTNTSLQICQRTLQSFDKILKTYSLEQSNFQKILGELYQQKMYKSQSVTQSAVVSKLMKKHAQEAFRKCHAMRLICCGPNHSSSAEALDALKAL